MSWNSTTLPWTGFQVGLIEYLNSLGIKKTNKQNLSDYTNKIVLSLFISFNRVCAQTEQGNFLEISSLFYIWCMQLVKDISEYLDFGKNIHLFFFIYK